MDWGYYEKRISGEAIFSNRETWQGPDVKTPSGKGVRDVSHSINPSYFSLIDLPDNKDCSRYYYQDCRKWNLKTHMYILLINFEKLPASKTADQSTDFSLWYVRLSNRKRIMTEARIFCSLLPFRIGRALASWARCLCAPCIVIAAFCSCFVCFRSPSWTLASALWCTSDLFAMLDTDATVRSLCSGRVFSVWVFLPTQESSITLQTTPLFSNWFLYFIADT